MSDIFGDDDGDNNCKEELKINKEYASRYNDWRQKEELNKLKTKYGKDVAELNSDDEEATTSSSEDEDANCLTEKCENDFYQTLSHLQNKDPKIYDNEIDFFADVRNEDDNAKDNVGNSRKKIEKEKEKPLYLRDYERKIITEHGGKFSDSEDESTQVNRKNNEIVTVPYVEEQRQILEEIKKGAEEIDDDAEIFKCKSISDEKLKEEIKKELLSEQFDKPRNSKTKIKKSLPVAWTDPNITSEEKFLRDYILNNKFLGNDDADDDFNDDNCHEGDDIFSEDEKYIDENQEFEHKYNYRFEEPDQEFIKRYPRTMEDSLRKKDTRRSQKRAEVKKRKEEEKLRQKEELKRLKALKRKEIMDRIAQLKEITGNDDINFDSIDLNRDFDPDEHDKKMQELFNDEYYKIDEDIKPEFPELDEQLGIDTTWDEYDPNIEEIVNSDDYDVAPHCDDVEFNMDADYDKNKSLKNELMNTSRKKRRRRSKFSEVIAKEKPQYDPNIHSSFKNYIDQYYALDYEDMIGDLPCRFKYRNVVPNDFGLTVDEILTADDKELNKWCSLKKALEHKSEEMELNEVRIYRQKASNEMYKKKILRSLYKLPADANNEEDDSTIEVPQTSDKNSEVENENKKKRKRKKKKSNATINVEGAVETNKNDEKLKGVGESSKKEKKLKRPAETIKQTEDNNDSLKISQTKSKRQKMDKSINVKCEKSKDNNGKIDNKTISKKLQRKAKFQQLQKSNKKLKDDNPVASLSDERLKAYKINPRKFKNKLKYGKKNE